MNPMTPITVGEFKKFLSRLSPTTNLNPAWTSILANRNSPNEITLREIPQGTPSQVLAMLEAAGTPDHFFIAKRNRNVLEPFTVGMLLASIDAWHSIGE